MSFILVLILLKRKLKIKVGYPVNVRIMIRIKYSWVLLLYYKIFCSFSMSCESVTGFYFSFVCAGVVVAEAGAGDSPLLVSGSLSLCNPPPTFREFITVGEESHIFPWFTFTYSCDSSCKCSNAHPFSGPINA